MISYVNCRYRETLAVLNLAVSFFIIKDYY